MNEADRQEFYNALKKYPIGKSVKKYSVTSDTYYTDTQYFFGEYKIDFLHWTPEYTFSPRDRIRIYKNNSYMCHWNKGIDIDKNMCVFDMYMSVKEKFEGKTTNLPVFQEKNSVAKPVLKEQSFVEKCKKVMGQVKFIFLNGGLDADYTK